MPLTANDIKFNEGGKAEIKQGNKVVALIYDRAVWYKTQSIRGGFDARYPYSLMIKALGQRECTTVADALEAAAKYINF